MQVNGRNHDTDHNGEKACSLVYPMAIHTFLSELKRRKVYRAAVGYAAVGWVLLEFADVAFPRLGLPDWTVNFVLALVLFGFPFAIVLAADK